MASTSISLLAVSVACALAAWRALRMGDARRDVGLLTVVAALSCVAGVAAWLAQV